MPYDLGDTVPLPFTVTDADDEPTTPTTVVLTIELPDGTTATPAPGPPLSTGRYEVAFVPTIAGRHVARWVSTGPAKAFVDVFDVRSASPAYVISLADAKASLNIQSSRYDEKLRAYIEAATGAIERYLGQAVVRRTVVETIETRVVRTTLALQSWPVVSLVSIVSEDGATTWDVSKVRVNDVGMLIVMGGPALSGAVVVTYIAGRGVIQPEVTLAARKVVQCLFEDQRFTGTEPPPARADLERDAYGVVISPEVTSLLGPSGPLVA